MVESGAALIDLCLEDISADDMTSFLNSALIFPDITRRPIMIRSSRWDLIEAGLKCLPGKGLVSFINFKPGDAEFKRLAQLANAYGASVLLPADEPSVFTFFDAASEPV
jgi:5-methyltetrahydrofolate--homocysteine methyltransferase